MKSTFSLLVSLLFVSSSHSLSQELSDVLDTGFALDAVVKPDESSAASNVLDTIVNKYSDRLGIPSDGARRSLQTAIDSGYTDELVSALEIQAKRKEPQSRPKSNSLPLTHLSDFDFHVENTQLFEGYGLRIKDAKDAGIADSKTFSGYLDTPLDHHLFYWFLEARNNPMKAPTVLWMNGGPGCSSMMGLFFEFGPSKLDEDLHPVRNPYAWNNDANILYVDNPVNVGFSYSLTSDVADSVTASKDVFTLLELFFEKFPEYSQNGVHVAAESYGGHYSPAVGAEILQHENKSFNLSSVMVGNGNTSPLVQYQHYTDMACGEGGWPSVLDKEGCESMAKAEPECQTMIQRCYDELRPWACSPAQIYCNNELWDPYVDSGHNFYDIRIMCKEMPCYDEIDRFTEFLNLPEVRKAIGVDKSPVEKYTDCNKNGLYQKFLKSGDWMEPYQHNVTLLLDHDIPTLIYAGDADFAVNWLGNEAWTRELEWSGHSEFANSPLLPWISPTLGKEMGQVRNHGHFTFLRLYDAGHMAPHDQPASSLDMFNAWLAGNHSLQ